MFTTSAFLFNVESTSVKSTPTQSVALWVVCSINVAWLASVLKSVYSECVRVSQP